MLTYRVSLEELGQNIVTVASGEAALQLLLEREFAVILLDVNMPGMSGLETAALIRQRKKSRQTPIIFITAFADEVQTAEGYALGAVDYILSPIVPEMLRAKVKVFVELFQMRAALTQSHSLLEKRVADRTAELEQSTERLRAEVHERKQAEERLTILVQELAHRVKNLLSVFQSITSRTLIGTRSVEDAREMLIGRLQSLGHAHELLTETSWMGADLKDIVQAEIAGFTERVRFSGPTVSLSPSGVQTFALIVHELSTNAAKYGALSSSQRRGGGGLAARRHRHRPLHGVLLAGERRTARGPHQARGLRPVADHGDGQQRHLPAGDRVRAGRVLLHAAGAARDDRADPLRSGLADAGRRAIIRRAVRPGAVRQPERIFLRLVAGLAAHWPVLGRSLCCTGLASVSSRWACTGQPWHK